jgi:hypothetical protein
VAVSPIQFVSSFQLLIARAPASRTDSVQASVDFCSTSASRQWSSSAIASKGRNSNPKRRLSAHERRVFSLTALAALSSARIKPFPVHSCLVQGVRVCWKAWFADESFCFQTPCRYRHSIFPDRLQAAKLRELFFLKPYPTKTDYATIARCVALEKQFVTQYFQRMRQKHKNALVRSLICFSVFTRFLVPLVAASAWPLERRGRRVMIHQLFCCFGVWCILHLALVCSVRLFGRNSLLLLRVLGVFLAARALRSALRCARKDSDSL